MNASAIVLHNVTRTEKGVSKPLLSSISATIPAGRLVALVGADGAGKTTLMRVLAGLLKPHAVHTWLKLSVLSGSLNNSMAFSVRTALKNERKFLPTVRLKILEKYSREYPKCCAAISNEMLCI